MESFTLCPVCHATKISITLFEHISHSQSLQNTPQFVMLRLDLELWKVHMNFGAFFLLLKFCENICLLQLLFHGLNGSVFLCSTPPVENKLEN